MKQILIIITFFLNLFCLNAQGEIVWTDPIDIAEKQYGNSYPRIVIGGEGVPLITWGTNDNVYFAKKAGAGFTQPQKINESSTPAYVTNWTGAELAALGDTLYICYMHKDWGGKTYIVRSFDGGNSFSEELLIENYADSASRFPSVVINEDGNPIVAIMKMDKNGHDPDYVIRKSHDFGESFFEEKLGQDRPANSEACDCCPASIKRDQADIALFYRANNSNIRDIWTSVSTNSGLSFDHDFAVDNSKWQFFSCPSSGPDGIVLEDFLYSVFLSDGACYLSKSSIGSEQMINKTQLGELPSLGSQNYPRIDNYDKSVGISWKGISGGPKLFVSYTPDINASNEFIQDTVYLSSFRSSDLALYENKIHLVWEDSGSGVVKYIQGLYKPVVSSTTEEANLFTIYPNPVSRFLNIDSEKPVLSQKIISLNGQEVYKGNHLARVDCGNLESGIYFLELEFQNNKKSKKMFLKQ